MKHRWLALTATLDALSRRDRLLMAGGLMAVVIGLDAAIALPLRAKRERIEQAVSLDATTQDQLQQQTQHEQADRLADVQRRSAALAQRLASLGLQARRDSLPAFLARTLRGHAIAPVGVRTLPAEPLNPGAADNSPAQPAAPALPAAALLATAMPGAAASSAATPTSDSEAGTLFRHRAELTFEGPLPELLRAIALTEHQLAPLRVERVSLSRPAGAIDGRVQAVLVLTAISQERTWFAL
jgi:hypothetical protein